MGSSNQRTLRLQSFAAVAMLVCVALLTLGAPVMYMFQGPTVCFYSVCAVLVVMCTLYQAPSPRCPGPRAWPILGSLAPYLNGHFRLHDWMNELASHHSGPDRVTWGWTLPRFPGVGSGHMIAITHPDAVKHVLKDNFENYVKG